MQNENFKCTQCGNSDLRIFNVPHSEKTHSFFVSFIIVACSILSAILFFALAGVIGSINFDSGVGPIIDIFWAIILFQGLSCVISTLVIFIVFYMLLPYKNNNVTEYYCTACGRQAPVNEIFVRSAKDPEVIKWEILDSINSNRATAIIAEEKLMNYAQRRSTQLSHNFSHDENDRKIAAAEHRYLLDSSEIIIRLPLSGDTLRYSELLVSKLKSSPAHWEKIINNKSKYIGIGIEISFGQVYCNLSLLPDNAEA